MVQGRGPHSLPSQTHGHAHANSSISKLDAEARTGGTGGGKFVREPLASCHIQQTCPATRGASVASLKAGQAQKHGKPEGVASLKAWQA